MKDALSERLPIDKLSTWLGVPWGTITTILSAANVKARKGYMLKEAIPPVLAHYKGKSERISKQTEEDVARQRAASADREEMARDREAGKLGDLDEMERSVQQMIVGLREKIRLVPWMTIEQKTELCEMIANHVVAPASAENEK